MIIRWYCCRGCDLKFRLRINLTEHLKRNCNVAQNSEPVDTEPALVVKITEKGDTTYRGRCTIADSLGEHNNFKMYITVMDQTDDGLHSFEVFLSSQLEVCSVKRSQIKLATSLFCIKIKKATDPDTFNRLSDSLSTWHTALPQIDNSFDYSFLDDLCKKELDDVADDNIPIEELVEDSPTTNRTNKKRNSSGVTNARSCPQCDQIFYSVSALSRHKTKTHTDRFKCPICDKRFAFDIHLKQHSAVHSDKLRYPCDSCKERFSTRLELKRHAKCHDADCKLCCEVCQQYFKHKRNLLKHFVIHTGVGGTFGCQICGKMFRDKWHLEEHERSHTDFKLYSCLYAGCQKGFSTKSGLEYHMNKHFNVKPYKCFQCAESFTQPKLLRNHEIACH